MIAMCSHFAQDRVSRASHRGKRHGPALYCAGMVEAAHVASSGRRTGVVRVSPRTPIVLIAALTIVQCGIRIWAAAGGWFYWDDFWWHDIVATTDLRSAATLSLGGHYSPLTYIPYWLITAWFPYEWAPRVVVMVLTLILIDGALLLVVRRLWKDWRPQVTAYALWCLSTLAAPSWLWYSQFSMAGTLLLLSTLTLWAYLRALQDHKGRVLAVALLAVSLLAQERMLVVAVFLVAFLVLVVRPPERWRDVARMDAPLWWASAAVMAVYTIVYRAAVDEVPGTTFPAIGEALKIAWGMVSVSAVPALAGGPWALDDTPVLGRAGPNGILQAIAALMVLSAVVISQKRNPLAYQSWAILLAAVMTDIALVVSARGGTLGSDAIGEWRYFSDLSILAPLLIVCAFRPPDPHEITSTTTKRSEGLLLGVFLIGALVTNLAMGARWHRSEARPFVESVIQQLRSEEHPEASIVDRPLPEWVVNPALGRQRLASRVFSIIAQPLPFDGPTRSPLWIDDAGELVPAQMSPTRRSGDPGVCPHPVDGTTTTRIPMREEGSADVWGYALPVTSTSQARLVVSISGYATSVPVSAGASTIYIPAWGSKATAIAVYMVEPGMRICVGEVVAGTMGSAIP